MKISSFLGINNVTDPLRVGLGWLVQADNVNVTDTGGMTRREGYTLAQAGDFTGIYTTLDFSRMYAVVGSALKDYAGNTLAQLTSTDPMFWTEVNDQVFFSNGTDSGIILPDNSVLPWGWQTPAAPTVTAVTGSLDVGTYQVRCTYTMPDGRETGMSDPVEITLAAGQALQVSNIPLLAGHTTNVYVAPANSTVYQLAFITRSVTSFVWNTSADFLGRELLNQFLDPLPAGVESVQAWGGRMYAAQYFPTEHQTVVWFSQPLGYHLFNLNQDFFMVPGHVHMLAPHKDALIVGTGERVFAYAGEKLSQLAQYGVVPGQHWSKDDERILFWTTRGLCSALPFTNLTEKQVSVAPGVHAGGCVVRSGGQKRYVAALQQGGSAFNSL
jgi:hypothetical protein